MMTSTATDNTHTTIGGQTIYAEPEAITALTAVAEGRDIDFDPAGGSGYENWRDRADGSEYNHCDSLYWWDLAGGQHLYIECPDGYPTDLLLTADDAETVIAEWGRNARPDD